MRAWKGDVVRRAPDGSLEVLSEGDDRSDAHVAERKAAVIHRRARGLSNRTFNDGMVLRAYSYPSIPDKALLVGTSVRHPTSIGLPLPLTTAYRPPDSLARS